MQNLNKLTVILILTLCSTFLRAQINYDNEKWLEKAEEYKPTLSKEIIEPVGIIELVKDDSAFQGWSAKQVSSIKNI